MSLDTTLRAQLPDDTAAPHPSAVSLPIPATLVPLEDDGRPRTDDRLAAEVMQFDANGMTLHLNTSCPPRQGEALAIGIIDSKGQLGFVSVVIHAVRHGRRESCQLETRFGGVLRTLLQADHFAPALDMQKCQFVVDYDEVLLRDLCRAGIFKRTLLDRLIVCPACRSLPSVRRGCSRCGSARFDVQQLVHHYACAWIAPVAAFETEQGLACPKCRTRRLVVGVDYEYVPGANHCRDCGQQDFEPLWTGHCLRCRHRFSLEEARSLEIHGYQARRLDLGALPPPPSEMDSATSASNGA